MHLVALLATLGALFTYSRGEMRAARGERRLAALWAARADARELEEVLRGFDGVAAAAWTTDDGFHELSGAGRLTREGTADLVRRARDSGRPAWDGDLRVAVPLLVGGEYRRTALLEFLPSRDPLAPLRTTYLILILGSAAGMAVTAAALRVSVIRPLEEVARGAGRVARGEFHEPVVLGPSAPGELRAVAEAFNQMMGEVGAYRRDLEARVGDAVRKMRAAEKTMVTQQRLAAMGTLAAGIAHDINNPLGGMINAVRALRKADLPEAKRAEYLALVEEGLERVGVTVQKVLQFTPHRVAPTVCDLASVARRALDLARHRLDRAGAASSVEAPPEGLPVFGDPYELQQVVLNLLVNAADAVKASGRGKGRVAVTGSVEGGEVRLVVEDDGTGMTEEQLAKAFDLFYTTKEVGEGTGLGLSMAHSVVESHGGRLELKSRPGEGTRAEIALPLHR